MENISANTILVVIIVLVSLYADKNYELKMKLMFTPSRIKDNNEYYRFITSGFIHSGYMHLFFNMFTMYLFGSTLESVFEFRFGELGKIFYVVFFIVAVIIAGIPSYIKHKDNPGYHALGASGGTSAIVLAYVMFFPLNKLYLILIPIGIPGFIFATIYLLYSYNMSKNGNLDGIGHDAHLFGALFGVIASVAIDPSVPMTFVQKLSSWSIF
ncbi:MAG: rhomboid family intramembrane serine protease [Flammeovirgaceae bacterium]|nr:rhomboid family intramembrane serine protease [Flammeovirgaceae bacterium]